MERTATMTHDEIMLAALKSGPKTNHELYRLGIMVHSRAASLRKKGHVIACKREGRNTYVYWLEAGACADPSRGAGAPASSGSNLGLSSGSPDTPQPQDGPLESQWETFARETPYIHKGQKTLL